MKNIIGIMREGRSKRGEKRTAITPSVARMIVDLGNKLIVQSALHPETGEEKRAFKDSEYRKAGAVISEDLSSADVIFGLKEIFPSKKSVKMILVLFFIFLIKIRYTLVRTQNQSCTKLNIR